MFYITYLIPTFQNNRYFLNFTSFTVIFHTFFCEVWTFVKFKIQFSRYKCWWNQFLELLFEFSRKLKKSICRGELCQFLQKLVFSLFFEDFCRYFWKCESNIWIVGSLCVNRNVQFLVQNLKILLKISWKLRFVDVLCGNCFKTDNFWFCTKLWEGGIFVTEFNFLIYLKKIPSLYNFYNYTQL